MKTLFYHFIMLMTLVPSVVILVACIIFYARRRSLDTLLMLIARTVTFVLALSRIMMTTLIRAEPMPHTALMPISSIMTVVSVTATLVFACALLHVAMSIPASPEAPR